MPFRSIKRFWRNDRGVALIEFAIVFPVMFLLLFGSIEVIRLMLIHQKLEKTGYVMADIVTQYDVATNPYVTGQLNETILHDTVFPEFTRIMSPYGDPALQAIILTSVKKISGVIKIQWQYSAGGGTLAGCDSQTPTTCVISITNGAAPVDPPNAGVKGTTATFQSPSTTATILNGMPEGENMIVSEAFYRYVPILQQLLQGVGSASNYWSTGFRFYLQPKIYVKRTYFAPRIQPLLYLPPTFPAP